MISRARRMCRFVERELLKRERQLESDPDLKSVQITLVCGGRTGNLVKGKVCLSSELDLVSENGSDT